MTVQVLADFGPLILPTDVDEAVIEVMNAWMPLYLRELSDERGLASPLPAPVPRDVNSVLSTDEFLDHQLPGLMVTTAKTSGVPERFSDGSYGVGWLVHVDSIVRGRTAHETRTTAALYEGATRRVLSGRKDAAGLIRLTRWTATEIAPVADTSRQGRYLAAGMTTFTIFTDQALKETGGLAIEPPTGTDPSFVPTAPMSVEIDLHNGSAVTEIIIDSED